MSKTTATRATEKSRSNAPDGDAVVRALAHALADSYVLYLKTQGVHWNATGPLFISLHALTESQYRELAEAIDGIAERIRSLGAPAPASWRAYAALTSLPESVGAGDGGGMARELADDHAVLAARLREAVALAEEADDPASADLLTVRCASHDKAAWMLRAVTQ